MEWDSAGVGSIPTRFDQYIDKLNQWRTAIFDGSTPGWRKNDLRPSPQLSRES
jgi:hypothetical protein